MKFCMECGTPASSDDQKFCKICGNKFPEMTFEPEQNEQFDDEKTGVVLPVSDFGSDNAADNGMQAEAFGQNEDLDDEKTGVVLPFQCGGEYNAAEENDNTAFELERQLFAQENDENSAENAADLTSRDDSGLLPDDDDDATDYDDGGTVCDRRGSFYYSAATVDAAPSLREDGAERYEDAAPNAEGGSYSVEQGNAFETTVYDSGESEETSYEKTLYEQEPEQPKDKHKKEKNKKAKKEKQPKAKGKKGSLGLKIFIIVLILALLGAGGFFGWRMYQHTKNVTVGGVEYSIDDTTVLSVISPDDDDWSEISRLTQLTTLSVTGAGDDTVVTEAQLEKLAALDNLDEISFNDVRFEDGLQGIENSGSLTALKVSDCALTSEQCASLSELDELTELELPDNKLSDIAFIAKCTGLTKLNISGNNISDYTALASLTGLESLSVDQCHPATLSMLPKLSKLVVNGEDVGDAADYVSEQKQTVDLCENAIGWISSEDTESINALMSSYTENVDSGITTVEYANGYLLGSGSEYDAIRSSLPTDAKIFKMDNSGIYYGQIADGKRSGDGIQYFAGNYSCYNGVWQDDMPNGSGIYRKTTSDGKTLEFSGEFVNGYENGTMTFTVDSQSTTYTAENGTRSTVKEISDTQYAFAQFGNTYWYDSDPTGHGVCVGDIAYQEEKSKEIAPASTGKSNPNTTKKPSGGGSTTTTTPSPSQPSGGKSNITQFVEGLLKGFIG